MEYRHSYLGVKCRSKFLAWIRSRETAGRCLTNLIVHWSRVKCWVRWRVQVLLVRKRGTFPKAQRGMRLETRPEKLLHGEKLSYDNGLTSLPGAP